MIVIVNNYRDAAAKNLVRIQDILAASGVPFTVVRTPDECRALTGVKRVRGVIFSGGNTDPTAAEAVRLTAMVSLMFHHVPKLYICLAMEVICSIFGSPIRRLERRESGHVDPGIVHPGHWLFRGGADGQRFRVNHTGYISDADMGGSFRTLALDSARGIVYACDNDHHRMYCVQFHPEADDATNHVIHNFIQRCKARVQR